MRFSPQGATSIDLHIRETTLWSRYRDHITIFAEQVRDPFDDVRTQFWRENAMTSEICKIVANFAPDIVIVHQHLPTAAALARRLPRIPTALIRHNFQKPPRNPISGMMKRRQFNRLACIGFVSEACLEDFRQVWRGIRPPTRAILNGVDLSAWHSDAGKDKDILFVGRLAPEKGAREAAMAMRAVLDARPDWRGTFIVSTDTAHTDYARTVEAIIAGGEGRISLLKNVAHDEVRRQAARASIALAPTQNREPFGRVAIEAMASGAVLIASARGGFVEIVGDSGILLPTPDAGSLETAILALIDDPDRRARLSVEARKQIAERYDLPRAVRSFDAMIDDLLGVAS